MKVWKLLLVGILIIRSQQQSPISSTEVPTADAAANSKNSTAKKSTFTRISDSLDAHARLTVSLNILAELIQPTTRHTAMSNYLNMNQSTFKDFSDVEGRHAKRIVDALSQMKTDSIDSKSYLNKIEKLERIYKTMNATVFPDKDQTNHMITEMREWKEFKPLDITLLEAYNTNMSDFTKDVKYSHAAALAMTDFPGELKQLMDQLPTLKKNESFHPTFWPIYHLITLLKSLQVPSPQLDPQQFATFQNVLLQSYNTGTRVAAALEFFAHKDHSFTMKIREGLSKDLVEENLRKTLNDGEAMEVLKRVLQPFFEVDPVLKSASDGIIILVDNKSFRDQASTISRLLNTLHSTRIASANEFNSSLTKFQKWLSPQISIPQQVENFYMVYKNISNALGKYQKLCHEIEEFKKSEGFKRSVTISSHIATVATAQDNKGLHKFILVNSTWFGKTQESFKFSFEKMEAFNKEIQDINDHFTNVSDWRGLEAEAEKWLKSIIKDFGESQDPIPIYQIKTGFEFLQLHTSTFKSSPNFTHFTETCSKLETALKSGMEKVESEKEAITIPEEFKEQLIFLNEGFELLREKLVAGSTLFKFFDRVILNLEKFDEFFKQGDLVGSEIRKMNWTMERRFDFSEKMKVFNITKAKYLEMKAQILARQEYYDPEPIEEIMMVRRLIDSLADIPNPELKTVEWKDFAMELHNSVNTTDFTSALGAIFDLDFANHQKEVQNSYANFRGLLRFHNAIESMERVKQNTFWNYNQWWIKFLLFGIITLVLNAGAYKLAIFHFKRQERKEAEQERKLEKIRVKQMWEKKEKQDAKVKAKKA